MKMLFGLIALYGLSMNLPAQPEKDSLPGLAVPGEQGFLSGELIFPLDQRPTPQCHASTLAESPGGLVAAWFGGSHEKNPDVGIWFARNEHGQWSEAVEVANGVQHESLRYPCWNPVLFMSNDGVLMLFFKVGPSPREWWGELMISIDGGQSWSDPRRLGQGRLGSLIGPVKNKPIQLEDGSLLCPSSTESISDREVFWKVHFERSRDLGQSWEVIGPINEGLRFDAIQPSILSYADGRLQILCRTRQDVIAQSWSSDSGQSWTALQATRLPNPSAGTDAVTLQDGRQLLVYNHSKSGRKNPGRSILNVALSENGLDWKAVLTLENQPGEYSYPAVIQTRDGLIHITYTYQRKSIKHVVLDPAQLDNPVP